MAWIRYGKASGHQSQCVMVFHTASNALTPAGYPTNVFYSNIICLDLASDPTG